MKQLTFKIKPLRERSIISLIRAINQIPCRVFLDLESGLATVKSVHESMIEAVIKAFSTNCKILKVGIDNTFRDETENHLSSEEQLIAMNSDEGFAFPFTLDNEFDEEEETSHQISKSLYEVEEKYDTTKKKLSDAEIALVDVIGFALDKLEPSKKAEEQVVPFLADIGMTTTEKILVQSFIVACGIKKVNYENVIIGVHDALPKINEEIIKNVLKREFNQWLKKYPTLKERCSKISLMSLLKVFVKRTCISETN